MPTIDVDDLFVLADEHRILAHLSSFDWDFSNLGEVTIKRGSVSVRARVIGSGNHEGHPVAVLRPVGAWEEAAESIREIKEQAEGVIVIERR